MAAAFRIDQVGPGNGTLDRSRHDLIPGAIISLVVPSPAVGATYAWELIDAVGSTAALSASSGTTVTLGPAEDVEYYSGFAIKLTETVGGVSTSVIRTAKVRSEFAQIQPVMFREAASASSTLAAPNVSASTDNALYANRAGRGASEQNYRGYCEAWYELGAALDSLAAIVDGLGDVSGALAAKADKVTTIAAGAGLTGGGDLSASRTLNIAAADSSITVNADSIAVGVINDTQHGTRGGASLHALASGSAHGFMSSTDYTKLASISVEVEYTADQTGTTYTLQLTDANKTVPFTNAAGCTVTIPDESTVNFPIGTAIALLPMGAGAVTTAVAGSATRVSGGSRFKSAEQYNPIFLQKKASNYWILTGPTAS